VSDRCPYCSDYESIKEELKETKRNAEKEIKGSLEKCRDERRRLKKQLVVVGVIIVIAGTLLGKEFVDKVAGYLESFNSVKDMSSDLISESLPTAPKSNTKNWPSFSNKPKGFASMDYSVPKSLNVQFYETDIQNRLDGDLTLSLDLASPYSLDISSIFNQPIDYFYTDWSHFLLYDEPESLLSIDPIIFYDPLDIQLYNSPPVPGPGVLMGFAVGLFFMKRRQR